MKKLFILAAAILMGGAAIAQPVRGGMAISGNIGYKVDYGKAANDNGVKGGSHMSTLAINPDFQYFISDRESIGLRIGFVNNWSKESVKANGNDASEKDGTSKLYVGPTYNYYFRLAPKFYLSLNTFLGYGCGFGKEVTDVNGQKTTTKAPVSNTVCLNLTPTLNYYLNDSIFMTCSVGSVGIECGGVKGVNGTLYNGGIEWGTIALGVGFSF